jgi:hypothetical protein
MKWRHVTVSRLGPRSEELDSNQVQRVLSKANITSPFVRYVTHYTHVWKECGVWHFQYTIQGCTVSVWGVRQNPNPKYSPEVTVLLKSIRQNPNSKYSPELTVSLKSIRQNPNSKYSPELTVSLKSIRQNPNSKYSPELTVSLKSIRQNPKSKYSPELTVSLKSVAQTLCAQVTYW